MSKEEIIVDIDKAGKLSVDVLHGKGKSCEEVTKFLTTALGQEGSKELKPEYRQQRNNIGGTQISSGGQ